MNTHFQTRPFAGLLLRAVASLALLAGFAHAQRAEILIQVHCSNVGGLEGQGKIDSPRKVEVDIEYPDGQGGTTQGTATATILRDGTARLAADGLASEIDGKGSGPDTECDVESTHPGDPDWVEREREIKLTLPEGVKVLAARVKKLNGKTWVVTTSQCAGHLSVKVVEKGTVGGMGRLDLLRDGDVGFGLAFRVAGITPSGDEVELVFRAVYEDGTATGTALIELAALLTDAGFEVALDGSSLWILQDPWNAVLDVEHGAWVEEEFLVEDDPDGPESYGEPEGWVGAGTSFTPLAR